MSDIVKRLNIIAGWIPSNVGEEIAKKAAKEAADEIERLSTALEWIAHRCPEVYTASDDPHRAHVEAAVDAGNCARAAISVKSDGDNDE